MAKRPKRGRDLDTQVKVAGIIVSLLSLVLTNYDRIAGWVQAADAALSWSVNVRFATVTHVVTLCVILYKCWELYRAAARQPAHTAARTRTLLAATAHFICAGAGYYVVLYFCGEPAGAGSIGTNVALELSTLYIAYGGWELARAIQGSAAIPGSFERRYAPAFAMLSFAAVFLGVHYGAAEPFGCSTRDALRNLSMFGSSVFILFCGWRLLAAAWPDSPWTARILLGVYALGLWARPVLIYTDTWSGVVGWLYLCAMLGKFGAFGAVLQIADTSAAKSRACKHCGSDRDDDTNPSLRTSPGVVEPVAHAG